MRGTVIAIALQPRRMNQVELTPPEDHFDDILTQMPRDGPKPLLRVGEASNPGPPSGPHARWRTADGVRYRDPEVTGFWAARAPGYHRRHGEDEPLQREVAFGLRILTANTTSWGPLMVLLRNTDADVVLAQEHHLPPWKVAEAQDWSLRHGWQAILLPAIATTTGGWSAGVGIFARPHAAMRAPMIGPEMIVPSRAVAACIEPPGHRPCIVISAYLHDGGDLGAANLGVLADIGTHIEAHGPGHPFVVGADFQVSPQRIAHAGFGERVGATLVASGAARGTCRSAQCSSEIDFFYVQNALALGIKAVTTVENAATRPHIPVALDFHPRLTAARALFLRLPQPMEVERVFGPVQKEPDWSQLRETTRLLIDRAKLGHAGRADFDALYHKAYSDWADIAELEIYRATGHCQPMKFGLRGKDPKLVWRSIIPERVADPADASTIAWRTLAGVATDLVRIAGGIIDYDGDGDHPDARDDDTTRVEPRGGERMVQLRLRQLEECRAVMDGMSGDEGGISTVVQRLARTANDITDLLLRDAAQAPANGESHHARADEGLVEERRIVEEALAARDAVTEGMKEAAAQARAEAHAKWRAWLIKNLDAGARNAHKFLRIPEPWRPTTTIVTDGVVSADPLKLLEGYRQKYLGLWEGSDADVEVKCGLDASALPGPAVDRRGEAPWRGGTRTPLARLSPEHLREASKSFKTNTMSTYDGIAMRHYALLSDPALDGLADLYEVLEITARLPPQTRLTTMPLIGKSRGGHRTVGSLPSNYRLWTRSRKGMVADWEASNDRAFIAAGTGRGPQDAVWRQAARTEAMARKGGYAATLLWDMASYYESLRRLPLWHRARRLGFPQVLLDVALTTYEGPRMLSLSGALSRAVVAQHGVIAGCSFANALTRAYSVEACDRVARTIADIPSEDSAMDMYVDDLAVTITGTYNQVVNGMSLAKEALQHEVETTLRCHIETSKAAVATSHAGLTKALARRFGEMAGPSGTRDVRRAAVNLGVDYAAGRTRRALAASGRRRRRMSNLAMKSRRLARIRSMLGRRAPAIFATGQLAEAEYGAAVHGFTDLEVLRLHRAAAQALTPRARGRSLRRTILLAGAPTWRAETAVIAQYARQVWQAVTRRPEDLNGGMSLTELSKIWHGAQSSDIIDMDSGRRYWQRTRGPISSMMLSLHRIGWGMASPFVMRDHRDQDILLTKVSPALLMSMLRSAVLAAMERAEGRSMAKHDPNFIDRRLAVEHVTHQLRTDRKLTSADVAAYKAAACGAIMTFNRAAELGYAVEDVCPLCGMAGDTLRHRIWRCTHPDAVRARNIFAPEWLQREQERRPASDALWTTGWFPHPADEWPRPSDTPNAHILYGESAEGDDPPPASAPRGFHGCLYGDGSCTTNVFAELRRAGTSVVQREPGTAVVRRVRCPVASPLPQTPQAAEYMVVALTQQLARRNMPIDLAVDCLNVVRDMNSPYSVAASAKRMQAGIARVALADPAWTRNVRVRKVKAHVKPENAGTRAEREDAIGNNWADDEAKAAVLLHPQPSPAAVASLEAALKRAKMIVRTIARVVQAFPPMPKERMVKPPSSVEGAAVKTIGGHDWVFAGGLWRCRCCLKLTLEPSLSRQMILQRCAGPRRSVQVEAMTDLGHVVARTASEIPIVFCLKCGAFTARRAYGLAAPCKGRPSPPGAQALARIKKGLQPWQRGAAKRERTHATTEAWLGSGVGFVHAGPTSGSRRRRRDANDDPHDDARARTRVRTVDRMEDVACNGDVAIAQAVGGGAHGGETNGADANAMHAGQNLDQDMGDIHSDEDPFGHGGSLEEDVQAANARRASSGGQTSTPSERPANLGNRASAGGSADMRVAPCGGGGGTAELMGQQFRTSTDLPGLRICDDTGPPASLWTDPPAWLYLPHLYPPQSAAPHEATVQARGGDCLGGSTPTVRQKDDKRARRWNSSREHEEANAYVMRAAFEGHRARVERKRAAEGTGDGAQEAPAAQRIEALRRRVIERADRLTTNARGAVDLAGRLSIGDDGPRRFGEVEKAEGNIEKVQAIANVTIGASAREGPGDPSARGSTAAAAEPLGATVAAAVARVDVAATPHLHTTAHPVQSGCGKAACGPPGGFAAPPEDQRKVVDSSVGRECCTTLQNMPHSRSGGGPHYGQRVLPPQTTPEESLGVGPSTGKHFCDDSGYPTQSGVLRGGGTVLASPRPLPQQRVAAAPQLGAATDSSPKGVESTTILALATECSGIPEQASDRHRTDGPEGAVNNGPRGRTAVQPVTSEAAEVTDIGDNDASRADATAASRRRPKDDGPHEEAKRPRRWASGCGGGVTQTSRQRGEHGERALLIAQLRGHPRPHAHDLRQGEAGQRRHEADGHREHEGRERHRGSRDLLPRQRGGVSGSGTGVNNSGHSGRCDVQSHVVDSMRAGGSGNGSVSRGGDLADLDAASVLRLDARGHASGIIDRAGCSGASGPVQHADARRIHGQHRPDEHGRSVRDEAAPAVASDDLPGGANAEAASTCSGPIRGRRPTPGTGEQAGQIGGRRQLIERLRGGQRHGPQCARSGSGGRPGKRHKATGTTAAKEPETGCGTDSPYHAISPQQGTQACGGDQATAALAEFQRRHRARAHGRPPEPGGAGFLVAGGDVEGAAAHAGHSSSASTARYGHLPQHAAQRRSCRSSGPHQHVPNSPSQIRGQHHLPGADSERASNEDGKIHQFYVHAGGIDATACHGRGAAGSVNVAACEDAAKRVAWHTADAPEPPLGGG